MIECRIGKSPLLIRFGAGVVLSIANSRSALAVQLSFLLLDAAGLIFGTVYDRHTPDLYPSNVHHNLGWILTVIMGVHVGMGVLLRTMALKRSRERESSSFGLRSVSHTRGANDPGATKILDHSAESGSARSSSTLLSDCDDDNPNAILHDMAVRDDVGGVEEKDGLLSSRVADRFLPRRLSWLPDIPVARMILDLYKLTDRLILLLGSVALTSGMVVYGGIFVRRLTPS